MVALAQGLVHFPNQAQICPPDLLFMRILSHSSRSSSVSGFFHGTIKGPKKGCFKKLYASFILVKLRIRTIVLKLFYALSCYLYCMDRFQYLNSFSALSVHDYELLSAAMEPRSFEKDEPIILPGKIAKEVYLVNSGVQMSYATSGKGVHVIAFTYAPNICTIPESFSFQLPSKYALTALTDTKADAISYSRLQLLFSENRAIEKLFFRMTEAVLAGLINRHVELHSLTMEERYKSFCRRSPLLLHSVPHKYIASYLSIDPTNFSKLFNKVRF
jgi:CRP-like cAMP-binding protein